MRPADNKNEEGKDNQGMIKPTTYNNNNNNNADSMQLMRLTYSPQNHRLGHRSSHLKSWWRGIEDNF